MGTGGNINCQFGCTPSATVHAAAEFDTTKVLFRANAEGGTNIDSEIDSVSSGADFQLDDLITPQGTLTFLTFKVHLDWSFFSSATSGVAGGLFNYNIGIDDPNCQSEVCAETLFSFEAYGASMGDSWSYSYFGDAFGGESGTGSPTLDIEIPYTASSPFLLGVSGLLAGDCGIYNGDRYGLRSGYLVVENNFNPEVGFKRRNNFKQYEGGARFSPRIRSSESIRRFVFEANTQSYWSATLDDLETRRHELSFTTEFEEGDEFNVALIDEFEMLRRPFQISSGVTLLPGDYDFTSYQALS